MRIAHVTATFPPYEAGTGRVCYYNALELARLGHEVTVFTANYPPGDYDYPAEMTVKRLSVLFRFGNAPILPGLIGLRGFDIVHLHWPFISGADFVWLSSLFSGTPYVITHHNDLIASGIKRVLFSAYLPLASRLVVGNASKFIAVSEDHAANCRLTPIFKKRWEDVVEVSNGLDTDVFKPDADDSSVRQQHNIAEDSTVITFVGALDSAHLFKGVDKLLEAFARMKHPDVILMIVGDGDMKAPYMEQAVQLGIAEKVRFTGKIPHDELAPYYIASDIVVLPSSPPESFGMVLIEAGACGRAVVASDIPGVRSVVDDGTTGLLTIPGDVDDLVQKLTILINNPEKRQEFGQAGHDKVMQQYTWPRAAAKLSEVYQAVLENKKPVK